MAALPMDSTTYLNRYQLTMDEKAAPIALHRGPSGVTYRAEDIETDQPVAVKLMPTYSFELPELQQLEGEARAAQKIDHPNIARLYDFGFSGNDVVFVTELLDGTTLDAWVAEHAPLPAAAVLRIALQVVSGLAAAAFHSVVHRAMQPANLMIVPGQTPDGEWPFVKVLNFGGVPPTLSNSAVSFGQGGPSPQFAAPEQLEGKPADFRSELYSLGCTMWFLLTGVMPTPGAVDKSGAVPKAVRPLLAQLVALDPMQRPQDPLALQQQLNDCLAVVERREGIARKFGVAPAAVAPAAVASITDVAAPDLTPIEEAPHRTLLKPLAIAAAVLLLAGLAAMALPSLLRSRQQAQAEPIGVPVGVPDASPAAVAVNNSAAATAAPQPSTSTQQSDVAAAATSAAPTTIPDAPNVAIATASPQAVVSNSPAAENDQALVSVLPPAPGEPDNSPAEQSAPPTGSEGATQSAPVASSNDDAAPVANNPAPVSVASNNSQAAPATTAEAPVPEEPTEVPNSGGGLPAGVRKPSNDVAEESTAVERTEKEPRRVAATTPSPTEASAPRARIVENSQPQNSPTPARAPKPGSKRSSGVVRNEVRPAEPVQESDLVNAPPIPKGTKRARYLGTTPTGDLIFGLPSDERGYVSPPSIDRNVRRARRARPVVEPAPAPTEEVRPAIPVDE